MKPVSIFLLLLCAAAARAQSLKPWTLAELAKRSDIICTGTVLKVEVIEVKKAEDLLNFTVPPPKRVTVARIKVTSRIKGELPDEIEMRYPDHTPRPMDWDADTAEDRIVLRPRTTCCFFLKRVDGELWYVSALDGENADGAAVRQPGAGPALSKKDAVQIATVDHLKADPSAIITQSSVTAIRTKSALPVWVVRFYSGKRTGDDSWDARILVYQDGSIDDQSVTRKTLP